MRHPEHRGGVEWGKGTVPLDPGDGAGADWTDSVHVVVLVFVLVLVRPGPGVQGRVEPRGA